MFVFCFQELLVIHFRIIVVPPLPPKIKIMTAGAVITVLCTAKEAGGSTAVFAPTWTVCIITDNTRHTLMGSTGFFGKDVTTPLKELKWKSDQWSFKNSSPEVPCSLAGRRKKAFGKEMFFLSDWAIKMKHEFGHHLSLSSFISLFIFHFELHSLFFLPFFCSPSLVPLSCSFRPENNAIRSQAIICVRRCKTKLPLIFCIH